LAVAVVTPAAAQVLQPEQGVHIKAAAAVAVAVV
jgi:hypothetical protein